MKRVTQAIPSSASNASSRLVSGKVAEQVFCAFCESRGIEGEITMSMARCFYVGIPVAIFGGLLILLVGPFTVIRPVGKWLERTVEKLDSLGQ